jgi:DNA-binding IclR family transcriptional regulator
VRLSEIAAELEAPRSSAHKLAKGLVANGYLNEQRGVYTIGPAICGLLAAASPSLERTARSSMEKLHGKFNETVMLCSQIGDSVVYIDTVESTQVIHYFAPLRTRRPLYPTSSGKCFLAFATERFRDKYLATHVADTTAHDRIRAELSTIAAEGIAINRGETLPDVCGVAVPIFNRERVAAALAIAGPTSRVIDQIPDIAEAAKQAAQQVSARIP